MRDLHFYYVLAFGIACWCFRARFVRYCRVLCRRSQRFPGYLEINFRLPLRVLSACVCVCGSRSPAISFSLCSSILFSFLVSFHIPLPGGSLEAWSNGWSSSKRLDSNAEFRIVSYAAPESAPALYDSETPNGSVGTSRIVL